MQSPGTILAATLVAIALTISNTHAGDWAQILGPTRNGVAQNERLTNAFPAGGPKTLWNREVGEGFAGVAVSQGRVILFHRDGNSEVVEGLDAASGERKWQAKFPASYAGGVSADHGPRCVPLIQGDRVILFGAAGDLHCLGLSDGRKLWSRATTKEFRAPESYFGAGSTPIVEGDRVLVNVGGKAGSGIVAFDLASGETLWQATDEQASYSSPTAITLEGTRHVIFVTRLSALSLDPEDGKVRWKFPFGARGPTVNAATPLVIDDCLFLSASYGVGAVGARIEPQKVERLWADNDTMSSQYATCVPHKGFLYGVDGRQDVGRARLRCFDPRTGKVRWTEENFGVAGLILADEKLLILLSDGTLVLAAADSNRYRELGRARVLGSTTRALAALADGRLFVRDERELKCLDLHRE